MKISIASRALTALAFLGLSYASQAITLDFEDLSGSGALPGNYAGLTWTDWNYYDSSQPPYNASSGVERIFNQFGFVPTLKFGQDVTFVGAWMAGYTTDQYIEGYNNGVKIFESAHMLPDNFTPFGQYLVLNWAGVDEIRVQSSSGNYYIIDDLQYTTDLNPATVPDVGNTLILLGSALSVLGLARRRLS